MSHTIVETFVGAGGAHIGFQNAGFKSLLVNDNEKYTIDTLLLNNIITKDEYLLCNMEEITQKKLKDKIKDNIVDVLFGGIVCKGFSLAGVRNPFDPRNYLYKHQLRLVKLLKPRVSIIENVVGFKNMNLYREAVDYRNNLFYSKKMPGLKKFTGNKLATAGRIILNDLVQKTFETNKYQYKMHQVY